MSLRVITLSDLVLPGGADAEHPPYDFVNVNFPTDGMRFLGLVAVQDPPRAGVEDTIAACQAAGIRVMMFTGDHPSTAAAIARDIGVFHDPLAGRGPRRSDSSLGNNFTSGMWPRLLGCV